MSNNNDQPQVIYVKEKASKTKNIIIGIIVIIILGCCGIAFSTANKQVTGDIKVATSSSVNVSNNTTTQDNKPKEGTIFEGIGREELENSYNNAKKQSQLKADQYVSSIKGSKVVWVMRIDNIENQTFGSGLLVRAKMNGYTVNINDLNNTFSDLGKGQLVKVTGNIDSISDFLGLTVYLNNASFEIIQ